VLGGVVLTIFAALSTSAVASPGQSSGPPLQPFGAAQEDAIALATLVLLGAAGGFLSTMHARPGKSMTVTHALLQGAAGATIIVTLAPVDNLIDNIFAMQAHDFIKLVALALIGGYAGSSLIVRMAGQYLKAIDEKQQALEENQRAFEKKQKDLETTANIALNLSEKMLRGLNSDSEEMQSFEEAVQQARSSIRHHIYFRADENRSEHWQNDKVRMARSIPLLSTLVQTEDVKTCHWWCASLAYCLKDKVDPDYAEAVKWLNKAIEVRNAEENVQKCGAYEFNRVICNIKLAAERIDGRVLDEQIKKDLEVLGTTTSRFKDIARHNSDVQRWLTQAQHGESGPLLGSILVDLVASSEATAVMN